MGSQTPRSLRDGGYKNSEEEKRGKKDDKRTHRNPNIRCWCQGSVATESGIVAEVIENGSGAGIRARCWGSREAKFPLWCSYKPLDRQYTNIGYLVYEAISLHWPLVARISRVLVKCFLTIEKKKI